MATGLLSEAATGATAGFARARGDEPSGGWRHAATAPPAAPAANTAAGKPPDLTRVIEESGDGVIALGPDGRCAYVDANAAALLGSSARALLGASLWGVFASDLGDDPLRRAADTGQAITFETRPASAGRWLGCRCLPDGDAGLLLLLRDITERREAEAARRAAEAERERVYALFEEAQSAARIGTWDRDTRTGRGTWSREMFRLFGFPFAADPPPREALMARIHPDDLPVYVENGRRARETGEPFSLEYRVLLPDGARKWVNVRGRGEIGDDGTVVRLYGTVSDVTARREREEEARRAADELRRSNAALEEFAYIASHDLKEPLRKIRTFGDLLRRNAGDALSESARGYIDRMGAASERMQALIDGLLLYSRAGVRPGKSADAAPADLGAVLRGVLSDLELPLTESGGTVEIAEPLPTVAADALSMRQLFQNLVSNALKFRREGVAPRVRVWAEPAADAPEGVLIHVADDGIGFSAEHAERIFGLFERLEGRSAYAGTGVGLAICRKIVERHGGSLSASAVPGEGATFTVRLPVTHLPGPPPAAGGGGR